MENFKNKIGKNYWLYKKDIYKILGFSRVDNFTRYLKNKKYNHGVCYNESDNYPSDVSLTLFFEIAKQRKLWNSDWEELFSYSWNKYYENKIIFFTKSDQKQIQRHDIYSLKVAGKFYTYSLNTINIAEDNDFDPFDIYKHCQNEFLNGKDSVYHYLNKNYIPVISFDSRSHLVRYNILAYLLKINETIKMSDFQKKRLKIYYTVLQKLLMMQFEIDCKTEERRKDKQKKLDEKLFGKDLSQEELSSLKKIYRQVAFLCHPDTSNKDGSQFKIATRLYEEKNHNKLFKLYMTITNEN